MRKYIEIYRNRIPGFLEPAWVKKALKARMPDETSNLSMSRWSRGISYPPVSVLAAISTITGVPTAYLVGQTDIFASLDSPELAPRNIYEMLEEKGYRKRSLAARVGTSPNTMHDMLQNFPNIRTNSLIALSDALEVSTDYLLGLSNYKTWGSRQISESRPFDGISFGTAAYAAPAGASPGEGIYCLVSNDGASIYTADGKAHSPTDEMFIGLVVSGLEPKDI